MSSTKFLIKSPLNEKMDLGNGYFINWFKAPEIIKHIKPGQFLMLEAGQYLNRPLSIYEIKKDEIGFLYKTFGKGTEFLSSLKKGDSIKINGPLGKGFILPVDKTRTVLIVAGGIGIATFPFVARTAHENGYKVKVLYGARSKSDLVCLDELSKYSELKTITDDGSSGRKGYVTELLEEEIKENKNQEIMACGPTPMLKNLIKVCNKYNVLAQISFEEFMACGYGVCMSCVVMKDGKYVRTCTEGPVMCSENITS
jgi:dihydroorotate dehydrogenase electron transfer subunit